MDAGRPSDKPLQERLSPLPSKECRCACKFQSSVEQVLIAAAEEINKPAGRSDQWRFDPDGGPQASLQQAPGMDHNEGKGFDGALESQPHSSFDYLHFESSRNRRPETRHRIREQIQSSNEHRSKQSAVQYLGGGTEVDWDGPQVSLQQAPGVDHIEHNLGKFSSFERTFESKTHAYGSSSHSGRQKRKYSPDLRFDNGKRRKCAAEDEHGDKSQGPGQNFEGERGRYSLAYDSTSENTRLEPDEEMEKQIFRPSEYRNIEMREQHRSESSRSLRQEVRHRGRKQIEASNEHRSKQSTVRYLDDGPGVELHFSPRIEVNVFDDRWRGSPPPEHAEKQRIHEPRYNYVHSPQPSYEGMDVWARHNRRPSFEDQRFAPENFERPSFEVQRIEARHSHMPNTGRNRIMPFDGSNFERGGVEYYVHSELRQRVSVFQRISFPEKPSVHQRLVFPPEDDDEEDGSEDEGEEREYEEEGSNGDRLEGMIFGCTCQTQDECENRKLFGLPAANKDNVLRLTPGTPLFLFNYETKKLSGVYEAVSYGKMNIVPEAYEEWGSFPAQVKVRRVVKCPDLPFRTFKQAIQENFYADKRFRYDLTASQVARLLRLFMEAREAESVC